VVREKCQQNFANRNAFGHIERNDFFLTKVIIEEPAGNK
jgi:hypothetical protein